MIFLYPLLFLLALLIAYLVLSLMAGRALFVHPEEARARKGRGKNKWRLRKTVRGAGGGSPKTCPLCASILEKGLRVKSVVFQGGVKAGAITERITHILGCPFCYPANNKNPRICPVCLRIIPPDGYLIARMFEKPGRERAHVHVLGCTACRKRGSA